MTVLETKKLTKYYGTGENRVCALNGINLKVEQGEFLTIVGSSGSGKSTLLHMLGGLDRPSAGSVVVDGKDLFSMKEEALTIFRRRKIGFVFQAYNLVPVLNVWENIILPVQLDGAKVDEKYIKQVIEVLGLEEKLKNLPSQLSGGQQQRVAIARALAAKPSILLADEPTGNLDSHSGEEIMHILDELHDRGHTLVVITHSEQVAARAGRRLRVQDGRVYGGQEGCIC